MTPEGGVDTKLAKALSHPLRQRLLIAFADRVASPSEIATELDEPLGDVSYHVRRLVELGYLKLVRAQPGRGGVKHYYTASAPYIVEDAEWKRLPPSLRHTVAEPVAAQIVAKIRDAATDGKLVADQVYLSYTRLELDDHAFAELSALLRSLVAAAERLERESRERRSSGRGHRSALSIAHLPS